MATHLLIGARAIAIALLLSLVPLPMSAQGAHAETLPIPANMPYDVTSAKAEDLAVARGDDLLQDSIITVLEASNGEAEQIGDEVIPLVASLRPISANSVVLFFEHGGRPHRAAMSCWRPPTHLSFGA
ncbi:hypothetical protein [Azospirillum formosense]|uniref:hypothetical protein n=1 Tax=Azospirillum formosense TaxID=861533 RepID=UPI001C908052|nr:hypothetical protein [Azospirillum formosense]MBY3757490.1 hypothetical protein [Azospirillum formosense]